MPKDAQPTSLSRRWLVLLAIWSVPGLIETTQGYVLLHDYEQIALHEIAIWQMLGWYFWLPITPLILWLGRRFPIERKTWLKCFAIHICAASLLAFPHLTVSALAGKFVGAPKYDQHSLTQLVEKLLLLYIHLDILTYWGVLAAGMAIDYYRRYREGLLIAAQLETKLTRAQLEALKMQLHPHFLFNTLHAIGVLVRKQDTKGALRMLTGLSALLRVTLDNAGKQLVPLKQELDFLKRYLKIERTRFGDRLTVDMDIEPEVMNAIVPNLALQPLVENAIRHGLGPQPEPGVIQLIACRTDDGKLRMEVRDNGVGLAEDSAEFTGMGLGNVRARLDQLYGREHRFEIADRVDGDGVAAIIEIPLSFEEVSHHD